MKVICAGFPKTGTKSLAMALRWEVGGMVAPGQKIVNTFSTFMSVNVLMHGGPGQKLRI